jgi:uncharacterized repeat protein (TIGR01451 family)
MLDAIPAGTSFVADSLTCDGGTCSYDAGLNAVLWEGTLGPAAPLGGAGNVDSLTGSYVAFDPAVGGDSCFVPGDTETFCFRAESYTPDFAYVYNLFEKFPTDWTVSNVYVQGTPVCDSGASWGTFSWSFLTSPYEVNISHSRYQAFTDHCVANYCFDVVAGTGSPNALESWYWTGDDYGGAPKHPCSNDGYTPAGLDACDEAVNPQAEIPVCANANPVNISFQVIADDVTCPSVVANTAFVSSEGNPDAVATANTDVYCSLEPDIVVTPLSLTATQPPDEVTTQQLQICNVGPSLLEWSLSEIPGAPKGASRFNPVAIGPSKGTPEGITASSNTTQLVAPASPAQPEAVLWDQPLSAVNQNAYVNQAFLDYPTYSSFLADDFVNAVPWEIDTIYVPGDGWNGFTSLLNAESLTWQIYADNAGIPAGDPSGGGSAPLWSLTLAPTDPQVLITTGTSGFPSNAELVLTTPINLPPGQYWLIYYPALDFTNYGQFGRQSADTANGYVGQFINPGGGFGYGTAWQPWNILGPTQTDIAFRLDGEVVVPTAPDVLLLNADSDNDGTSPIQSMLQAFGDLGLVDLFDARSATPSLAQLQAYDVVVTWTNNTYFDPIAIGNVLADYVDSGGKVINAMFSIGTHGWQMGGRFMDEGYTAFNGTDLSFSTVCLGTYNPSDPIMAGVTDVCEYYRLTGTYLTAGSHEVAQWADGLTFVAAKDNQTVVSMNAYVGYNYQWTGQMDVVLHNAILWLSGGSTPPSDIPWLSENPTSGTVDGFACTIVDVSFDSTGLAPATYTGELDVNSNDPDTAVVPVDVTLNVLAAPDISVDPTSLTATLFPNAQETQNLNVCNSGQSDLLWTLAEVPGLKVNSVTQATAAKPAHKVTLGLDANGVSAPTGPAPITPNGDVALVLDDGSRDNDIGIGGLQEFIWVNRFTPNSADFPFQINEVWIYFSSAGLVNVGDDIKIVFYENTTGGFDPAPGSNYLGGYVTTVQALDVWNVYTLPSPVWFNGPTGDAIIGVIGLEVPGSSYWPASIDQTVSQQRSWAGWWNVMPPPDPPILPPDASWILIDDYFPGNWMVRGYGMTGSDVIPWLSENPTEGTVPPGECAVINVTFDSTGLGLGTYSGALDIASNDPDEPNVVVPVTLNVVAPVIAVTPDALELTLFPNETGTLVFNIANNGTADLTWEATDGATWLSELPASGTVLPGESTAVDANFDSTGLIPGVYETNIVIASNDPATPEFMLPVTLTVEPLVSDLSIVKTGLETVKVGEVFTYTLVIANAGPQEAAGVMVFDTLPTNVEFVSASEGCIEDMGEVTCDIGTLAVDEEVTLTIAVKAIDVGTALNTAVVSSDNTDPNLENNTSTVETEIIPAMYYFYLPIVQKH